jgi:dTDP-4-dehydrorhamnose reductase
MVGNEAVAAASEAGWDVVGLSHAQLDVGDRAAVRAAVASARPDVVLNAAAYTRVDAAETEVEAARRANAEGPGWLAEACVARRVPLVHISTDYVFDGRASRPYRPDDPAHPLGVYGRTKWDGEQAVRERLDRHLIVRTSWVFASHGRNFLRTIVRLAREREVIPVVADQTGSPTLAADLARALLAAAAAATAGAGAPGTYHFRNSGETTWHGFASAIVGGLAAREDIPCRSVVPVSTADYPAAAPRPAYSVLDTTSWTETFGAPPRPWQEALAEALCRLT